MKVQRKQGLVSNSDSNNKHSPNNKRSLGPSPVAHRPLRDRIIHLLALKPYRKPELLLWLERERATPKDKTDLTSVLEEVRHLGHFYVKTLLVDRNILRQLMRLVSLDIMTLTILMMITNVSLKEVLMVYKCTYYCCTALNLFSTKVKSQLFQEYFLCSQFVSLPLQ